MGRSRAFGTVKANGGFEIGFQELESEFRSTLWLLTGNVFQPGVRNETQIGLVQENLGQSRPQSIAQKRYEAW